MAQIENIASKWEPSTWTGFNSLRFDDNFLRHGLYAGLLPAYLTQYNGNTRSDVLRAAQLASVLGPAALRAGKTTFTLEALAAANGFGAHETHDALGDVRATTHMLRTIATRAPSTWELLSRLADKNAVFQLLRKSEFVLVVEHFGTVIARPVIPVCPNPGYETEWLGIDVTADPASLLCLPPELRISGRSGSTAMPGTCSPCKPRLRTGSRLRSASSWSRPQLPGRPRIGMRGITYCGACRAVEATIA